MGHVLTWYKFEKKNMPRPITKSSTVYYLLTVECLFKMKSGGTLSLHVTVRNRLARWSHQHVICVRPPTPIRWDSEISNSTSIDQRQVVAKVFVKFVSSGPASPPACKASYHADSLSSVLRGNTHFGLPRAQSHNSRNKCLEK
jgi:hypothetical protein